MCLRGCGSSELQLADRKAVAPRFTENSIVELNQRLGCSGDMFSVQLIRCRDSKHAQGIGNFFLPHT